MAKELVKAPESLSVWMSNMKELVARQPKLGAVLHSYVQKYGHEFAHFENKTPAGTWVEGLSNVPFFQSDEDPKVDWDKKSREVPIFFQYGIGTPPYLFKVIRSLPDQALSLVVIEPNIDLLVYVLHMTHVYMAMPKGTSLTFFTLPEEVPENIRVSKGESADEELPLTILMRIIRDEALEWGLNVHGLFTVLLSKTAIHKGEEDAFRDDLLRMAKDVREWLLVRLQALGNSSHDTMLGLRQMALMSPWIVYGSQYESILAPFKDRPFVVVSAGPSLAKNYELLKDVQDRCVIVANDAVLKKLLSNGIRPHIVCALERGIATYDLLFKDTVQEYPEECGEILLISQAVCSPKLFGTWPGPKMIVGKGEVPVDQWFIVGTIHGRVIPSGSSVAHMCFGVAVTMGASSIALIGQDLAYGEEGVSHVSGVFSEEVMAKQQKGTGTKGVHIVPAALGGETETSELWLSFLRMFEARITSVDIDVFDCTEGGALIRGTIIEPFSEYLADHVASQSEFEETPAEVVLRIGVSTEKKTKLDSIKPFFEKANRDIDEAGDLIVAIAKSLDNVSAAALSPERRVRYATETAVLMDKLNRLNPMFAFIAQSYMYLSSAEIAVTRFLDNVETVERWIRIHREIVEGHVTIVRFIKNWLDYATDALYYYVDKDLPMMPFAPDVSYDRFKEVCETLGNGADQVSLRYEMDRLFTFADMVRDGWPGDALWSCAMFLLQESRSEEAEALMAAAAGDFEDLELPTEQIYAFFKDYARVSMTPDLCHLPKYDYARLLLENAIDLCGEDAEIKALLAELSERQKRFAVEIGMLAMGASYNRRYLDGWYAARSKAADAMSHNDPMTAMTTIWEGICKYGQYMPGLAAPHLNWLAKNMEKFFGAQDEPYKSTIDALWDDIASHMEVLKAVPIYYTAGFISALAKHGAGVVVLPTQEEESEIKV